VGVAASLFTWTSGSEGAIQAVSRHQREADLRAVARLALRAALDEIARLGGGTVAVHRYDVEAVRTSSSVLHGGTLRMFIDERFEQVRQSGESQWVVSKTAGTVCAFESRLAVERCVSQI